MATATSAVAAALGMMTLSACRPAPAVRRVTKTLECSDVLVDGGHRRYDSDSVRVRGAWVEKREREELPFSGYESRHFDELLAEGIRRICNGEHDDGARYVSVHRPEFGWPMDACMGERFITVWRGREKLELGNPRVQQMMRVDYV